MQEKSPIVRRMLRNEQKYSNLPLLHQTSGSKTKISPRTTARCENTNSSKKIPAPTTPVDINKLLNRYPRTIDNTFTNKNKSLIEDISYNTKNVITNIIKPVIENASPRTRAIAFIEPATENKSFRRKTNTNPNIHEPSIENKSSRIRASIIKDASTTNEKTKQISSKLEIDTEKTVKTRTEFEEMLYDQRGIIFFPLSYEKSLHCLKAYKIMSKWRTDKKTISLKTKSFICEALGEINVSHLKMKDAENKFKEIIGNITKQGKDKIAIPVGKLAINDEQKFNSLMRYVEEILQQQTTTIQR